MSHWKYPPSHTRWLIDFPWDPYHGLELPISITQSPGIFNGSPSCRAASPGPSWVPSSAPCALPLAIADRAPNAMRGSGTAGFLGWIPSRVLSFWLTKLAATLRAGVPQNQWFPYFVWMIWGSRFELRGLETSATAHSASFKARSLAAMVAAGQEWEEIWRKKIKDPQSWCILGRFKGCRILATWHDSNYGKIVVANLPICMWQSLWAHCTDQIYSTRTTRTWPTLLRHLMISQWKVACCPSTQTANHRGLYRAQGTSAWLVIHIPWPRFWLRCFGNQTWLAGKAM